jgi:uncharacterized membrane protein YjfL (UPF0719 family)
MKKINILVLVLLTTLITSPLFASGSGVGAKMNWVELGTTFMYGLMGIILSMIGYKVYDIMVPFDIHKEIAEDQNTSLGIVLAAIILGVSIIVAAAIAS